MNYWLMKSEPSVFGIDDLKRRKTEPWDGVRNYQARNMLRDEMKPGDLAFFYHSSCAVPGIAGVMEIVSAGYPDPTAFMPDSPHFDSNSDPARPRWYLVDVRYKRKLKRVITLEELCLQPPLAQMKLLQKGNRLSIMPLARQEWDYILKMEKTGGS
jgi:predicted RNA-binding protein with PUA-like domain